MRVLIIGDVHAGWGALNQLINKKKPALILQCGDFGYWPGAIERKKRYGLPTGKKFRLWPPSLNLHGAKLLWCPGNHEYWSKLIDMPSFEEPPGVHFMPRKSVFTLPDGRNVLFMGGADSTDKADRQKGFDWFPEEIISQTDVIELPDKNIDIVISHTCPSDFEIQGFSGDSDERLQDPSRQALSVILKKYNPSLWYFGHFHTSSQGITDGCKWYGLSMSGRSGWWRWLE